jgi:cysteine desulfurase
MDIYLDANATTPILTEARLAALEAMECNFGNPSSVHGAGLRARLLVDSVRATARRVLGATSGHLVFVSGATEGIQTAVLSALAALRTQRASGTLNAELLLYGATEHKAVPESLKHWNHLLGLNMQVAAIPVDVNGRHDVAWLRKNAARAGLVCTMAANNETGVMSDLDGIESALEGTSALWLVDGVQALGKMPLALSSRRIDYAPFSGHKLYAPKGIGLLYVREGAPYTPLMAGGGQEDALRSGTENMIGIAGLGAVLSGLESQHLFRTPATLALYRDRLAMALQEAFSGLIFNVPHDICLPTTLNFSVPGLASRLLQDVFDAADVQISGGSACSASKAAPSYVLEAMGLPFWQAASAVRLSFGPAVDDAFIDEACTRIRACGAALRASGLGACAGSRPLPADGLLRFSLDGACCYVLSDAGSRSCIVVDPTPALAERIVAWVGNQEYRVVAVLSTGSSDDAAASLRPLLSVRGTTDAQGWPGDLARIELGRWGLTRMPCPFGTAFLLHQGDQLRQAFIGQMVPTSLSRSLDPAILLLPSGDTEDRYATTVGLEQAGFKEVLRECPMSVNKAALNALVKQHPDLILVDVREPYEQRLGTKPILGEGVRFQAVSLSALAGALPEWLQLPSGMPVVFFCRAGNRSARAARALRRLGHESSWSLAGGMALWPA